MVGGRGGGGAAGSNGSAVVGAGSGPHRAAGGRCQERGDVMTWTELLAQCAWRGTIILLAAFAANGVMRKAPAAWRHFLWTAALSGLLILPAMVQLMPKWDLQTASGVLMPGEVVVAQPGAMSVTAVAVRPSWNLTLLLWLAGCGLTAGWFLVGRFRAWMLLRRTGDAPYAQDAMARSEEHTSELQSLR